MRSRLFFALPCAALVALTACGSSAPTTTPGTTEGAATTSAPASAPATTTGAAASGTSKLVVDGKNLVSKPAISCSSSDNNASTVIAIVDMGTADYQMVGASAAIETADNKVTMFSINAGGGSGTPIKINYNGRMPGEPGSVTATKSGNVWTLTGEAKPEDGPLVPFEVVADCS
ncbi:lipoprotein LpqH [Ammonicoccus fulvus]|uniref:Lipoprotein LpqH n=1 Tax=Ammonicoccus fulvus TaxID=3138240 RepID=A0ABZ3FKG8_9ACTN